MYIFAWGLQPTLCHPSKGGYKDILEWIGVSFNSQPWVLIKMMLHLKSFSFLQVVWMFFMPIMETIGGTNVWMIQMSN
jgi:hypothetical protein